MQTVSAPMSTTANSACVSEAGEPGAVSEAGEPGAVSEAGVPGSVSEAADLGSEPWGISDAARLTGVSAHALRYYERLGLVTVARDMAGHRRFSSADLRRITFLTRLRQTGMPIREIQRYFELADAGPETEPERLALLARHRDSVRARLATLQFALDAIEDKITRYGGSGRP